MPVPDKQLSAEQSRQIADTIREEIARRRISRQSLAELAKLRLSTLQKVLGGRRPFTLATTVRLEQALAASLRKTSDTPAPAAPNGNGDIAPDGLGAYSRRAVAWIEGTYVTVRPSFGDKDAIFAYSTEIVWHAAASSLVFHGKANGRTRPSPSSARWRCRTSRDTSYLVTNRHGRHRLITVAHLAISSEMYGIITTLLAGRGSSLTPIAAPIASSADQDGGSTDFRQGFVRRSQLCAVPPAFAADDEHGRSRCSCRGRALPEPFPALHSL